MDAIDRSEPQPSSHIGSGSAASHMLRLQETIFHVWEDHVRERILSARALKHPVLIDTLPLFYGKIVESVSTEYERTSAVDGNTMASEHGGERARLTSYDHSALIDEYQLLRSTIFQVLGEERVFLDPKETHAIHASIDAGIREAVEAFSLVQSGFRERFAAALMHDLRTPLSANLHALELILLTNDLTTIKVAAAKAISSAKRIGGMVNELLDTMAFHGGENVHLTIAQFDVWEIVKEVEIDGISSFGSRFSTHGELIQGWWDKAALKRALENLVSNAVKYGSPTTIITIKLQALHGRMILSVHNEGPPISPQEQECIFQMYRRAENVRSGPKQGWGIGLPYVRAVAESHGGSIGLDSTVEQGTTFFIDIPLDSRPFKDRANSLSLES